jgi:hypothetical protein
LWQPQLDELAQAKADAAQHHEWVTPQLERLGREMLANSQLRDELVQVKSYIASLPADWFTNSSLETWFPITAMMLTDLRAELAQANERIAILEFASQRLNATLDECGPINPEHEQLAQGQKRIAELEDNLKNIWSDSRKP